MPTPPEPPLSNLPSDTRPALITGADLGRRIDALFVNAPLRDYAQRPRVNDFTLPVLGMGYLATYAASRGFNVGVLDAEAHGLGIDRTARIINDAAPRWAGFNLLAPTYESSARIATSLDPGIKIMLGGHQAKAMPTEILTDPRISRCAALVLGEGETRVAELLTDDRARAGLPGVMWLDPIMTTPVAGGGSGNSHHLAPDINGLPFVDRGYLAQDPHCEAGRLEANMVGARGCPYNCSFCGAAVSANPDITIRTRDPYNIVAEMQQLREIGVTAFRFVDDLFLGARRVIDHMMAAFTTEGIGDWAVWDATGRINVLHRITDDTLDILADSGLREVALGIESGSERMLKLIDKRIDPSMTHSVVRRLTERGINVKGYFILGFPTETCQEIDTTIRLVHDLWELTDPLPGRFRVSAFEYRPYPGTPDWHRLMATGRYTADQLLNYTAVDLTDAGGRVEVEPPPAAKLAPEFRLLRARSVIAEVPHDEVCPLLGGQRRYEHPIGLPGEILGSGESEEEFADAQLHHVSRAQRSRRASDELLPRDLGGVRQRGYA
ncbi:MAG: radical SAM protein [Pseudonocardiaceae bacterium]|nr:radical SAM protein [Pseudonocardiaceae bacterium]